MSRSCACFRTCVIHLCAAPTQPFAQTRRDRGALAERVRNHHANQMHAHANRICALMRSFGTGDGDRENMENTFLTTAAAKRRTMHVIMCEMYRMEFYNGPVMCRPVVCPPVRCVVGRFAVYGFSTKNMYAIVASASVCAIVLVLRGKRREPLECKWMRFLCRCASGCW